MIEELDFFNNMSYLEPKCPKCGNKIDYGITTTWNDQKQAHLCNCCRSVLK